MASIAPQLTKFKRLMATTLPRGMEAFTLANLPAPAIAFLAACTHESLTYLVCPTPARAEQLYADLTLITPLRALLLSPADDEAAAQTGARTSQVQAITSASIQEPLIVVSSIHALIQPIADPKALAAQTIAVDCDQDLPFDTLAQRLTEIGYRREEAVYEPLTFSIRGGIVDIWTTGSETPTRLEFFGDTIESIRTFDPMTQCSTHPIKHGQILPTPAFKLPAKQILTLSPPAGFIFDDHNLIDDALDQLPLFPARIAKGATNVETFAKLVMGCAYHQIYLGDPAKPKFGRPPVLITPIIGVRELGGKSTANPEFYARTRNALLFDLDKRARTKETIYICAESAAAAELIGQALPPDSPVKLIELPLSEGFTCANIKLTLIAQSDLYPIKRTWKAPTKKQTAVTGQRIETSLDIQPGELVVHLEHGIGRFVGLTEIEMNGVRSEVFTLAYANGAKLHVPTTHAHLLSRYIGPNPQKVKLHSLDGMRWIKEKRSAESGVEDLAANLLETQARRRITPGFAYDVKAQWIAEFEALFPYQETVDQTRVIAEIKADMASTASMDRLVCGDAGYGKTEVAMRAAFIAVMNHKQVAVLAPTTVLAEQHYETFCDRMSQFPIKIDVLSRFRTVGQRAKTRLEATQGKVDILIGTHALLSENIPFKDVGLLIIDEEQRFGVAHKEMIKRVRSFIDVLTLSATPIPRTLYLSMTGARDLSLLQTPPSNRVAVETIIQTDSDEVLRPAILRELGRGGQVFYLYNRVMTIGRIYKRLRELVPEAKIAVAHGQMSPRELAAIMKDFEGGHTNLLICTTIVESGIDIPRANTILIDRADRFGIADLYQLRGRVGRSIIKGYAYLLLPSSGNVDSQARQRLGALKRHSGLGAGYNLALRDLEIRGAGNLLGAAQSGHIATIGFTLYCQLLRRTVARLKGEKPPVIVDVELSLDFIATSPGDLSDAAATIPYSYVEDDAQRMGVHRKIAEATSLVELRKISQELTDRFGKAPHSVERFFKLAQLRLLGAHAKLSKIEVRDNRLTFFDKVNRAPLHRYRDLPLSGKLTLDKKLTQIQKVLAQLTH